MLITGSLIATLSLISYSIGFFSERKNRSISKPAIMFFTFGLILDITATTCMIIGSGKRSITFHGILGYSALAGMLVDSVLLWKYRLKNGEKNLSSALHLYTGLAYSWWLMAYFAGFLLGMIGTK